MTDDNKTKKILGDDTNIPISIYDIAYKNRVYVLIQKGNTQDINQNGLRKDSAVCFQRDTFIRECSTLYKMNMQSNDDYLYYLLLNIDNPLKNRIITAYYLIKLYDKPKLGRYGYEVLNTIPIDKNYSLALKLLAPENDLTDILRNWGYSKRECLYDNRIFDNLCMRYLLQPIDMENRLKL